MARPKKGEGIRKRAVTAWVNEEEHGRCVEAANGCGMTLSDWARALLFGGGEEEEPKARGARCEHRLKAGQYCKECGEVKG